MRLEGFTGRFSRQDRIELLSEAHLSTKGVEISASPTGIMTDFTKFKSLASLVSTDKVVEPYAQSVWVYSAIKAISSNISQVPYKLSKTTTRGHEVEVTSGPLHEVLNNPNPLATPQLLFESTFTFLDTKGEAFWILDGRGNVTDIPTNIWSMPPDAFQPIVKNGRLAGWQFRNGRNTVNLNLWEVVQFKYFSPFDPIRGLSPLTAAALSMDQDFFASLYNRSFFQEGAAISGFISTDKALDDIQYNRLLNQFEERHKGMMKAHKIALLEGGAKFQEAKLSQKDMDFIALKNMSREEIFAIYKVNAVILGLYQDVQSYEGIKMAHKAFWQEACVPRVTNLKNQLFCNFYRKLGLNIQGDFDLATVPALAEDFLTKVTTGKVLKDMGYHLNEINRRLEMKMEEVPYGDVSWMSNALMPVKDGEMPEGIVPTDGPEQPSVDPALADDGKKPPPKPAAKPVKKPSAKDVEVRDLIKERLDSKLKRHFFEQRKELLSVVMKHTMFVPDGAIRDYINDSRTFDLLELSLIFSDTFAALGVELTPTQAKQIQEGLQAVHDATVKELRQWRSEGQTQEVADAIRQMYNQVSKHTTGLSSKIVDFIYGTI